MASPRGTRTAASAALIVLLALAGWWLQDRSEGEDTNVDTSAVDTDTSAAGEKMPGLDEASGLPYVALEALPPEAADVVALIDQGGPFPYDKDGSTFGNYEGLLPARDPGYYREYTVETPGSYDRGARRIVGGAEGELYWTEDHYESFEVIWR